jgi:two-component system sensor histidine kinase EvgS
MNAKGTGLGLSICKNIIEQMGGSVHADSIVDIGTEIIITIGLRYLSQVFIAPEEM